MNSEIILENNFIKGPLSLRITLIGNNATGKTSLINRIINNNFSTIYLPTMKMENYGINLNISENNVVKKTYVMINFEDM
jgi:GTPase SAR1 family protein